LIFILNKLIITKKGFKMTSQELFDVMKEHWAQFEENHARFTEKGTKAAGVRARKSINELKKLSSKYRSTQMAEIKAAK
jgi:hypothetical protein